MFEIYEGKKVLVTGHCGFKGSWICRWLNKLGAEEVYGYGHPPNTEPNHYELLNRKPDDGSGRSGYAGVSWAGELLEFTTLSNLVDYTKPDLVIHLAAKAIVARTFTEPRETFENNVMGAVNILEACRKTPSVKGIVMITTDKIYENREWNYAYREVDELGGVDPYSASKVCIEQVIRCYRESFGMNIATARAGNVIGGGDWSYKRLIPDIVKATNKNEKVVVHTPNATRPFQHVLDALQGYLLLGQKILEGENVNRAWNFGPDGEMSVLEVLTIAKKIWPKIDWEIDNAPTHPHMVYLLKIDSTEARKILGWRPVWNMKEAVIATILWYMAFYEFNIARTDMDIEDYEIDYERGMI